MPTYQYRCEECGKKFERTKTEHEAEKSKCPKCGSRKVSYVPRNVYVVASKKELGQSTGVSTYLGVRKLKAIRRSSAGHNVSV